MNWVCYTWDEVKAFHQRTEKELFSVLCRIQNIGYDLGEISERRNYRLAVKRGGQP